MSNPPASGGVNAAHTTGHAHAPSFFKPSQQRRCFNHDYRAPCFYMVTLTTHERRPWFGTCENDACTLNTDGWAIYNLWQRIPQDYPNIAVSTLCIMPDHLHGILHVKERMEKPVGVAIRAFKAQCTRDLRDIHHDQALSLWDPGYNDRIVWRHGSLPAFTRYLMDNPRRLCLKRARPDLFRTIAHLQHPCLPPLSSPVAGIHASVSWSGYGNRFLLDRPEKHALRVSRKATPAKIAALREEILAEAAQGVVIVSPFISPGEQAISQAIIIAAAGDVILLKHTPFTPLYKPSGRYFDLCVQGRLLILAHPAFHTPLSSPVDGVHANSPSRLTRATALALNAACSQIAEHQYTEKNL
jgi:REP element-mobilizing transposase RayT